MIARSGITNPVASLTVPEMLPVVCARAAPHQKIAAHQNVMTPTIKAGVEIRTPRFIQGSTPVGLTEHTLRIIWQAIARNS
jgi:hypothetical protein